ncbi:MAG: MarR family winged helix-turn-helix transcriptional regulator [Thermoplasmata archaeon]
MVTKPPEARAEPGPEEVVRLMGTLHDFVGSALHRLRPILGENRVTMGQFLTLHVISSLQVASVGAVARRLGISAPAASVSVDQLEEAGLVRRRRSERDARTVELTVTARGHTVETRIWKEATRVMGDTVRGLSVEDVTTAVHVFDRIARRLEPNGGAHWEGTR